MNPAASPTRPGQAPCIWGALLGLGLVTAAGLAAASDGEPVRVALSDGVPSVEIGLTGTVAVLDTGERRLVLTVAGPRVVRVAPSPGGLALGDRRLAVPGVRLEPRGGESLRLGGREYGGILEIRRSGDGLLVINELPLEAYVAGTVRAEVSEQWPAEALRALAVAARTYAVFHQARNAAKPFHLVASSQDQNFAGRVGERSPAREAARATACQVLMWQGQVFPAFYHSDSGGVTEPPQSVFSGDGIPPLDGVRDDFSLTSPHVAWVLTLPLGRIAARLRQGGVDVGDVTRLMVVERTPSLRVARIAVVHSRGVAVLRGVDFRRMVGYDVLKSTLFDPVAVDGHVRFEGRGFGHGVGLSQFGARRMAERGYAYAEILQHYYPGAALKSLR
jgi:stage II sporulation protein D